MKALVTALILAGMLWVAGPARADTVFVDIDGVSHNLADYRGSWVLVNFFATWCPPCLQELPELVFLNDKHNHLAVIGIDMETIDKAKLKHFIDDNLINYPVIPFDKNTPKLGSVPALPTSYLIDPHGKLIAKTVGAVTADEVEDFIKRHDGGK